MDDELEPGLIDSLKRHWRALTVFTVLVAAAAIYMERHFFPDIDVVEDERAPVTPATPVPPATSDSGAAKPDESKPADSTVDPQAQAVMSQAVTVDARPVALIKGEGKWDDAPKLLAAALVKLKAAVEKGGLTPGGRPIAVFTRTDEQGFKFEAMTPLKKAPEGKPKLADGVEIGSSPSGKALKFQHRGAYDEIDATYEAIAAYLDEKGVDTKDLIVEEYLTDFKGDEASVDVDIYVFLKPSGNP